MVQSYKKNPDLSSNYDVIIIGSGMGGLTTASILAKEGKRVLVLERHYTAGGFTHVFKRKGYEWDVGIHYIGDVGRENSTMQKLFAYITNDGLQWADMGEVYDRIYIGDKSYDFVKGTKNFKNKLNEYFPGEEKAIDKYVGLLFKSGSTVKRFFIDRILPPFWSALIGRFFRKPFYRFSDRTTYDVLKSLTDNEELIKVLTGQYGDYGLTPKKSSFAMHATVARHYLDGGYFPVGGSSKIVEKIEPIISNTGGCVVISAEVDQVIVEDNRAVGVRMIDGKEFFAKSVVSGAGVITTFRKLLPPNIAKKHGLEDQLKKVNPSVAHACLYIGLNGSPADLQLPKTNFWIYPDDLDHDGCVDRYLKDIHQEFPVVYISFPSAKDPDWINRYPGKSTIDIITLVPFERFKKWEGSSWMKRGSEYDEIKESLSQRLLQVLFKKLPHLANKVDHYELSSPLTTQHFINYEKGEIYGLDHSPERFRQRFLKPRTPIKNFYLTGQDIATAGVGGALFSGVLTSASLLGKNVMKKMLK